MAGRLYLAALLVVTLLLGWRAAHVGIESDNRSLTVLRPDELVREERLRATFGRDDDLLLAVVHPTLLGESGLRFLDELTSTIRAIPGVGGVHALTTVQTVMPGASGADVVPLVPRPLSGADFEAQVRARLDQHPEFTGLLVSADRQTAGLLIELATGDVDAPATVVPALRVLMAQRTGSGISLHLTGIAVQKHDVNASIARDQRLLVPLAVVTLGLVLLAFFRRPLGVLLPLAVTGISVVWTLGAYQMAGLQLNAITALLPPVLMVLSMAVSVHLIEAWLEANERDAGARLRAALRRTAMPVVLCTLTTALGFVSLASSEMPAVRSFGLFAALGVVVSCLVGLTLVPVVLSRLRPPGPATHAASHGLVARTVGALAEVAVRAPGRVLIAFAAVTALATAGLPLVRNNTDLVRFLKPDAPLFRDTMLIDQRLMGPNTLDFVVSRIDGTPLTRADDVRRLGLFERAVRPRAAVSGVTSIGPVLEQLQAAEEGGSPRLPEDDEDTAYLFDLLAEGDPALRRKLVAPDARSLRLNVRVHAIGTAEAAPLAVAILDDGRRIFGPAYEVEASGPFHRVALDSNDLVAAQVHSFGLALLLVFGVIGVIFRSLSLVLVVAVANVMPIVWTGGLMGFAGIDLSTGTAMIASCVIGIVVDDTIHFLTAFRRAAGLDAAEAVRLATREAGPALLVNNLVLVLGFWVGCFGSFKPTILFSLLSGFTMLTAMLCDLLVTPACLVLLGRFQRRGAAPVVAAALVLALGLGASGAAAEVTVPPELAPVLVDAGERRWARTSVPDETRKVGEVRLLTRGGADVVQTVLSTTLLPRAVREIRGKEAKNWPEGSTGHEDAMRYVAALEAASAELGRRVAGHAPGEDRRRNLLIEFVLTRAHAWVVLSRFEPAADEHGEIRVDGREPLAVLSPSREYVRSDMRLIVEDSFDAHGEALEKLLTPLPLTHASGT